MVLRQLAKELSWIPYLTLYTKINSKCIIELNVNVTKLNYKTLEENIVMYLHYAVVCTIFS